jgi:hypothetical protein
VPLRAVWRDARRMGNALPYTLQQAGTAVGLSKSSILRAIRRGSISAVRDARGNWAIEPAELHRAFPPVTAGTADDANRHDQMDQVIHLRARLEAAELRIADKDDQIADLRRQRDAEAEERRRLTAVLADMRAAPPAPARRSWWRWR